MTLKHLDTLKFVAKVIPPNCSWMVVGSMSCRLQGMDWDPNDVDILTTKKDFSVFKKKLAQYLVKKKIEEKKGLVEQEFLINDVVISVFYEFNSGIVYTPFLKQGFIKMSLIDGVKVPLLWLEKEAKAYRKANRLKKAQVKAQAIEKHLKRRSRGNG